MTDGEIDLLKSAERLKKTLEANYKKMTDAQKREQKYNDSHLVDPDERLKKGLTPLEEINDWYKMIYKLTLAVTSYKRGKHDEALRDMVKAVAFITEYRKKVEANHKKWRKRNE